MVHALEILHAINLLMMLGEESLYFLQNISSNIFKNLLDLQQFLKTDHLIAFQMFRVLFKYKVGHQFQYTVL